MGDQIISHGMTETSDTDSVGEPGSGAHAAEAGASGIGAIIHSQRKALGLSLQQVAERVGCGRSYISMIETGVRGEGSGSVGTELFIT